jgi:ubiquinone/menaquinone biosynthesis C-methylase UbiE
MGSLVLEINVEETRYEAPSEWRMLGARGKADHVVTLCRRHGIEPIRVLEVGAGDGSILRCLSEAGLGAQLYGLEISQSGVDVIREQRIPGLVSCGLFDGYAIPFEDDFFDVAVLSHVLEHVEYERALLRELKRVSKRQVIEIPMDCYSLGNEVYQLLGPSYGHINAHTPESLRFLLSTEGLQVDDDLLGRYSMALLEYDYFVNNSREQTSEAIATFRQQYQTAEEQFSTLPRAEQQRHSTFYTVLTRKEESEQRQARVLKIIKQCVISEQVQAARLIFDHYVPKPLVSSCALEVARAVADSSPRIALEFLDRVVSSDTDDTEAPALRSRIETQMANPPSQEVDHEHEKNDQPDDPVLPSHVEVPGRRRRAKEYLKATFPGLASAYRRLRR